MAVTGIIIRKILPAGIKNIDALIYPCPDIVFPVNQHTDAPERFRVAVKPIRIFIVYMYNGEGVFYSVINSQAGCTQANNDITLRIFTDNIYRSIQQGWSRISLFL